MKSARLLVLVAVAGAILFVASSRVRPQGPLTCVVGDAEARAEAVIPVMLAERYLDARRIQFGLGDAAIGGWTSLGDALITGGRAWLRTTYSSSPNYYALVTNRYFQTNSLAYVPFGVRPSAAVEVQAGEPVYRLWQKLAREYPGGVMVEGYAQMQTLHTIAIAQPAFNGLPILAHTPFYYTEPMESATNAWVYLVGITARLSDTPWWADTDALKRLVPRAQMSNTDGLADVLRLRTAPASIDLPPPVDSAAAVGQMVGSSTLAHGRLHLYPIHRIEDCADAYVH